MKTDQIQSRVETNVSDSVTNLKKLENELKNTQEAYKNLGKQTKANKEEKEKLKKETIALKEKITAERKEVGLAALSYNEILKYKRDLARTMANLSPLQDGFNDKLKDTIKLQKEIDTELAKRKSVGAEPKSFLSSITNQLPSAIAGGIGGALVGVFTGVLSSGMDAIDRYTTKLANLSDELADIQIKTNQSAGDVKILNSELGRIDTRTATSELRQIVEIGGDLNVAEEDVLGFVSSVDKLKVAFGDDLGSLEQAAETTGKIVGQFKEFKDQSIGDGIESIGSGIKALADDGPATVKTISEFLLRIGQLPEKIRPAAADTAAYAAVLEEAGLTAEISSGGLSNLLLVAAKNTKEFAKFFGLSKKGFEELINTDPNGFLLKLAERFKGADPAALGAALKNLKVDSQESVKVLGVLADNVEKVKDKQILANTAMSEATRLSEAFAIKNSTLAAELEKFGKRVTVSTLFAGVGDFLKAVLQDINKVKPAETLAELSNQFRSQSSNAKELEAKLTPLISRYDQLTKITNRNTTEQAELRNITRQVTALMPSASLGIDQYGNSIGISTGKVRELIEAQKAMLLLQNKTLIGTALRENYDARNEIEKLAAARNRIAALPRNARGEFQDVRAGSGGIGDRGSVQIYTDADLRGIDQQIARLQEKQRKTYLAWKGFRGELDDIVKDPKNKETTSALLAIPTDKEANDAEKQQEDAINRTLELAAKRIEVLSDLQDKEEAQAALAATRELVAFKGTEAEKAEYATLISEQLYQKIAEIRKKYDDKAIEDANKLAKKLADINNKILTDEAQREVNLATRNAIDNKPDTDLGVYAAKRKQLLTLKEIELSNTELSASERLNVEKNYIDKLDQLWYEFYQKNQKDGEEARKKQTDTDKKAIDELRDKQATYASLASQAIGGAFSVYSAKLQNRSIEEEKAKNQSLKRIDQQVKYGTITQQAADAAKEALEAKAEERQRQARRKQAIAERIQAVFTVTVQGIINAIKALTPFGKVAAGIEAGIAVASLLATPLPQFFGGGYTETSSDSRKPAGIVHANEYVVPARVLQMPGVPNVVGALEAIRTNQPYATNQPNQSSTADNALLLSMVQQQITATTELNDILKGGITAKGVWEWDNYKKGVNLMQNIESQAKATKNRH